MKTAAVLLAAGVLALATGAVADPASKDAPTLATLDLGTHWFGPEITKEDLRGKVVLFQIWGS